MNNLVFGFNFFQYKISFSTVTITVLLSLMFTPVWGQEAEAQLVNPDQFEQFLPETLGEEWETTGFSGRTSDTENWGGAAYMGPDARFFQIGISHYKYHDEWKGEQAEAKEEDELVKIGEYTAYEGTIASQTEFNFFLENNFLVSITGEGLTKEIASMVAEEVKMNEISGLVGDNYDAKAERKSVNNSEIDELKSAIPDKLVDMQRGKIQAAPNQPVVKVVYGREDLNYSVNVQLASGELVSELRSRYKEELKDSDLEEVPHDESILLFRDEESSVSYMAFYEDYFISIAAISPANTSLDKESARDHLRKAYDEFLENMK